MTGYCPNCGAQIPEHARACPECGSCEATGWSEGAECDRLGIPGSDDDFDYEDFVKREFGGRETRRRPLNWIWVITGVVVIIVFVKLVLGF